MGEGITDHSTVTGCYVIFSTSDEMMHARNIVKWLKENNISYKPLIGKFAGEYENSWIIPSGDWQKILDSGLVADQETFLFLWDTASAYHEYGYDARKVTIIDIKSGVSKDLGAFVAINDDDLQYFKDWTWDIINNRYYVVKDKEGLDGGITK